MKITSPLRNLVYWITISLLLSLYICVKYFSPHWIVHSYHSGQMDLLQRLSGVNGYQSLAFYLGVLQDKFFGPVTQILSIFVLVLILMKFFLKSNGLIFGLVIFFYLCVTKFEALFFPCYGESGSGPVTEAIWLYRNAFDYQGLLNQLNVDNGGPKVYMFSLYPGFVAFLLTLIPSIKVFYFVYHSIMFALGSVAISLFRSLARELYEEKIALLGAILFLSIPLFQTMVELMNMEMLCLFFGMLGMFYLCQKRIIPASIFAVLSSFAKGPGGIFCATCCAWGVIFFLFDSDQRFKWRNILCGSLALILGASKLYLLRTFVSPVQMPAGTIKMFIGWAPLRGAEWTLGFYAFVTIAIFIIFLKELFDRKIKKDLFLMRHLSAGIAFTVVTAWIGMYLNISVMGPRYKLIMSPFLIFCVLYVLNYFIKWKEFLQGILIVAIFISALGSYGLYCKNKIESDVYSFNNLERTLEYRNDLFLNQKLADLVKERYLDFTIGAPYVIAQHYAMPELGYVEKPLDVVLYGMSVYYADIKNFSGLGSMNLPKTIWIAFKNKKNPYGIEFPIDSKFDKIVHTLEVGDKKLFVFLGGAGIQRMAEKFYIMQMEKIEALRNRPEKIIK